jgi:hypothetical protein
LFYGPGENAMPSPKGRGDITAIRREEEYKKIRPGVVRTTQPLRHPRGYERGDARQFFASDSQVPIH